MLLEPKKQNDTRGGAAQLSARKMNKTEGRRGLKVRKALAGRALNGMASVIGTPTSPDKIKLSFYATVESVLPYCSECWTLGHVDF